MPELFSAGLISPEVQASLPKGYTLRPLSIDDYDRGFFDVFSAFRDIGPYLSKDQFLGSHLLFRILPCRVYNDLFRMYVINSFYNYIERFNYMKARNDEYFIIVLVSPENRIIGTGTILVERKFIFNAGLVSNSIIFFILCVS